MSNSVKIKNEVLDDLMSDEGLDILDTSLDVESNAGSTLETPIESEQRGDKDNNKVSTNENTNTNTSGMINFAQTRGQTQTLYIKL